MMRLAGLGGLTNTGVDWEPRVFADVPLYVMPALGAADWCYHGTRAPAFCVSEEFYFRLLAEVHDNMLTGNPGPCERALYNAARAVGWA